MLGFFLGVMACVVLSYFFPNAYNSMLRALGAVIRDVADDDRK